MKCYGDCKHCGQKGLLGHSQRHRPCCGAGQDPKTRYFPKKGEEVAVKDHKFVGADKVCPACSHPMAANVEFAPHAVVQWMDRLRSKRN